MPYALVTGAAKGIGKAIAEELAIKKYNLILVDFDTEGLFAVSKYLETTYQIDVHLLYIDLSEPDAIDRIFSFTRAYHEELSVVVNNAGYGLNGSFEDIPLASQLNIIDVNIRALVKIAHTYIPVLRKFDQSYLLIVASTTAYQTVPYLNIYASTKAFVLSFARGLRYELRNSNISVTAVSPGSTDTDFVNRANMSVDTKKIADRFNMTPKSVAQAAIKGLFNKEAEVVPGFVNKLNAHLPKFFPKSFVEKIAGNIYQKKEVIESPI
jgi:short-subunit dehydrogenase